MKTGLTAKERERERFLLPQSHAGICIIISYLSDWKERAECTAYYNSLAHLSYLFSSPFASCHTQHTKHKLQQHVSTPNIHNHLHTHTRTD